MAQKYRLLDLRLSKSNFFRALPRRMMEPGFMEIAFFACSETRARMFAADRKRLALWRGTV